MKEKKFGKILKVIRINLFSFSCIDSYIIFLLYLSYYFYIFFYDILVKLQ
jgi:hypothetical protein